MERNTDYILVVEDDRDIQDALVTLLSDFDYAVRTASNGKEALELLASPPAPSLILLDQMMPVMDGEQLMEHLAAMPSMALLPVCVLTAVPNFQRDKGVVAILQKPFDETVLMSIVERYCRTGTSNTGA